MPLALRMSPRLPQWVEVVAEFAKLIGALIVLVSPMSAASNCSRPLELPHREMGMVEPKNKATFVFAAAVSFLCCLLFWN